MRALGVVLALAAGLPGVHHTPAGMAAARASLITHADLGTGWTTGATPQKVGALACKSPSSLKGVVETGAAVSPTFRASGSGPFVSGSTFVYDSAAGASRFFAWIAKPQALPCLAQTIATGKAASGVTFTVTKRQSVPPPRAGVTAAEYRVVGRASVQAQNVTLYADVVLLQRGTKITELSFAAFSAAMPAATETRIARAAAARL